MELIKLYMGILFTICLVVSLSSAPSNSFSINIKPTIYSSEYCPLGIKVCDFKGKVRVDDVLEFTPAYTSGIEEGDRILEINGMKINNIDEYKRALRNSENENIFEFTVYRVDSCSKFSVQIKNTLSEGDIGES